MTLQDEIAGVLSLIRPWRATDHRKLRIGGPHDGGYVMIDAIDDIEVCYSLGVGPDVTWDMAMARRGALVFQYDHTVDAPPEGNEHFRFHRVGITHDETANPTMREIGTLLIENGHAELDRMVLKMDIEGHEWDCLAALPTKAAARFRQIVVEFHGMRLLTIDSFRERARKVFSNLSLTHQVVHVHGNNFGEYAVVEGMPIPDVIELTWVRRNEFSFALSDEVFPTYLDAPCNSAAPDLRLGLFRFT